MKGSYKLCEVCRQEKAEGVYSSKIAPVSCAYCRRCIDKGAEPYGILVTAIAHLVLLQPSYILDPNLEHIKQATLEITGKNKEKFQEDVEKRKEELKFLI